jgi:ERCC4-type nuclease
VARTPPSFTITVDTREQQPWDFRSVVIAAVPFEVVTAALETGDYAALGDSLLAKPADQAVIERKSLVDLYHSVSQGRVRLEAEFKRMQAYGYAALVVEADLATVMRPNDALRHKTYMQPKALLASLLAWSQRYGVHLHFCPDRLFAERFTHRLLERWARDHFLKKGAA